MNQTLVNPVRNFGRPVVPSYRCEQIFFLVLKRKESSVVCASTSFTTGAYAQLCAADMLKWISPWGARPEIRTIQRRDKPSICLTNIPFSKCSSCSQSSNGLLLYCTVLYCTVHFTLCTVLCCTVQYCLSVCLSVKPTCQCQMPSRNSEPVLNQWLELTLNPNRNQKHMPEPLCSKGLENASHCSTKAWRVCTTSQQA